MKRTYWWLRGLPPLFATYFNPKPERFIRIEPLAAGNPKRKDAIGVGEGKAKGSKERSRFFPGMAAAMAKQWGSL